MERGFYTTNNLNIHDKWSLELNDIDWYAGFALCSVTHYLVSIASGSIPLFSESGERRSTANSLYRR